MRNDIDPSFESRVNILVGADRKLAFLDDNGTAIAAASCRSVHALDI